jgi:hypothetical protein
MQSQKYNDAMIRKGYFCANFSQLNVINFLRTIYRGHCYKILSISNYRTNRNV